MLQLVAIKTKSCVYLSDDITGKNMGSAYLISYLYDGVKAKPTYMNRWIEVSDIPTSIQVEVAGSKSIKNWVLEEGYIPSDKLPQVLETTRDIRCEPDDNDPHYKDQWEHFTISSLYKPVYIEIEGYIKDVEFEISIIEEFDGEFKFVKKPFTPEYNFLDKLNTHPALLETKPCKLSCGDSYKVVREHIKANIDTRYARITSDYDFCFAVVKTIPLVIHEPYQVNTNIFGSKKKPKYETRYRKTRDVPIFEMAPKPYQSYTVVKPFEGSSYNDMMEKVDNFLKNLMEEINAPLTECPHCCGTGVTKIFN